MSEITVATQMLPSEVPSEYFTPRWYAVYTRSRHEKRVADECRRRAIETFLPVYETLRDWKNGRHWVELALFPGYVFLRIALCDKLEVVKVYGVVRLVGFNGTPTPLADEEIGKLRRALAGGILAERHPYLTTGRRVRITGGPLAGQEGILVRRKGQTRVVLSVDLIQRSILVQIDAVNLAALA